MFNVKIKNVLNEATGEVGNVVLTEDQVSDYLAEINDDLSNVVIVTDGPMTPDVLIEQKVLMDEIALAKKLVEGAKKVSDVFPVEGKYSTGLKKRIAERRKQVGK